MKTMLKTIGIALVAWMTVILVYTSVIDNNTRSYLSNLRDGRFESHGTTLLPEAMIISEPASLSRMTEAFARAVSQNTWYDSLAPWDKLVLGLGALGDRPALYWGSLAISLALGLGLTLKQQKARGGEIAETIAETIEKDPIDNPNLADELEAEEGDLLPEAHYE